MSFLLRRNRPWSQADWRDLDALHARADENPIKQPWGRYNSSRTTKLVSNELFIADYSETTFSTGGASYEHKALTPWWAIEFQIKLNTNNFTIAEYMCFVNSPWSRVGQSLYNVPVVKIRSDGVGSGTASMRVTYYDTSGAEQVIQSVPIAAGYGFFNGVTWHTMRFEFDNDEVCRTYVDGILHNAVALPDVTLLQSETRSINFSNQTTTASLMRSFRLYDRNYNKTELTSYADNFNTTMDPRWWKQSSTPAQVSGGIFSVSGTDDGYRRYMYLAKSNTDKVRVSAVASGPNSVGGQGMFARSNLRNTRSVDLYLSNTGWTLFNKTAAETWVSVKTGTIAIATGDNWGLLCDGSTYQVQKKIAGVWTDQGTPYVNATIPFGPAYRYSGLDLLRVFFNVSGSWDSWAYEDVA